MQGMMGINRFKSWLYGLALLMSLAACQTAPQPEGKTLTEAQRSVLRTEGFVESSEGWELQMPGKMLFAFDSSTVDATSRERIAKLGQALLEAGIDELRVEGHTDSQGSDAYNKRLSLKRAEAVNEVLVESGFQSARIKVLGLGSDHPLQSSDPAENRRVAVVVPLF